MQFFFGIQLKNLPLNKRWHYFININPCSINLSTITLVSVILSCILLLLLLLLLCSSITNSPSGTNTFQCTFYAFKGLNPMQFWHTNFLHHFQIATLFIESNKINKLFWRSYLMMCVYTEGWVNECQKTKKPLCVF